MPMSGLKKKKKTVGAGSVAQWVKLQPVTQAFRIDTGLSPNYSISDLASCTWKASDDRPSILAPATLS